MPVSKHIEIGESSFPDLILRNCYYVDKSRAVREVLDAGKVVLLTRPRRFGKTLTMSMLQAFLEMNYRKPEDRSFPQKLFAGLATERDLDFCKENMGMWPVISLSFRSVEGESFEEAMEQMKYLLACEADRFSFLLDSPRLSAFQKQKLQNILELGMATAEAGNTVVKQSIATLEAALCAHYGKKAVLLIDEYDVPLQKARINGYYDQMVRIVRGMFSLGIKDAKGLHKAVLTGCLRVAKESVFTGTNNFYSFGVSDQGLSDVTGFTVSEVEKILEDFNLSSCSEGVRENYDGYRFGNTEMYCPWDVLCFCKDTLLAGEVSYKDYWVNTSGNDLVLEFVDYAGEEHLSLLRELMDGRAVVVKVDDSMSFADLSASHSAEQMLSLLYATGYLTKSGKDKSGKDLLKIPNREIRDCFEKLVDKYFSKDNPGHLRVSEKIFSALLEGKTFAANSLISMQLMRFMTLRDAGERIYHGLLLGMFADACGNRETRSVQSNAEAGDGYGDLLLADFEKEIGVILELKKARSSRKEDLARACREGLLQIRTQGYARYFDPKPRAVKSYSIAFSGKHCMVMQEGESARSEA